MTPLLKPKGWGGYPSRVPRRRSPLQRLFLALTLFTLAAVGGPALFVGVVCYDGSLKSPATQPSQVVADVPGYRRSESLTYLTFPERFVVYHAHEYAKFIEHEAPSRFPYFSSIRRFWDSYASVCSVTKREYWFDPAPHVMLGVIGARFTIGTAAKALYEMTVGRFTEAVASRTTPEDAFAARTAAEYSAFLHTAPWYEFPFTAKLGAVWFETPPWGPAALRKWERRFALTAEYGLKAMSGWVAQRAAHSLQGPADMQTYVWIDRAPASVFGDGRVRKVKDVGSHAFIAAMPRRDEFTRLALRLLDQRVRFLEIAGNDEILLTALASRQSSFDLPGGDIVFSHDILTDPQRKRIAVRAPVRMLNEIVAHLRSRNATIEFVHDY